MYNIVYYIYSILWHYSYIKYAGNNIINMEGFSVDNEKRIVAMIGTGFRK